jgi:two-component system, NarL family, sensor histidine kinase UhpB
VPTAIHDLLWVRGFLAFESVMWLPLTMPLVLLAISATVANRFARAWVTAEAHNRDLSSQVEEARRELAASYEARLRAERREVAASERSMLVEDLHDGVGNRLSLLLATARSPGLSSTRVMSAIRECLDDLRMVMAARDHGNLGDALAEIGALQADVLEAADVLLEVECEPAARNLHLGARRTLNLLRIVQEAVLNAVHHAGARRVSVTCALAGPEALEVRVADDGDGGKRKGASPKSTGRGMSTMAARAERLGAEFSIDKSASGWTVRLLVPIAAGAGPELRPDGQDAMSRAQDRLPRGGEGKPVPKGLAESQA